MTSLKQIIFLLICCNRFSSTSARRSSRSRSNIGRPPASSPNNKIDLSYLFHLSPDKLAAAIQERVQQREKSQTAITTAATAGNDDDNKEILVDVSHCALGDAGFPKIVSALLPTTTTTTTTEPQQATTDDVLSSNNNDAIQTQSQTTTTTATTFLQLAFRRNELTPRSARLLLERLYDTKTMPAETMPQNKAIVTGLDLGWNHLATDEFDNDNFLRLLQQVVGTPTTRRRRQPPSPQPEIPQEETNMTNNNNTTLTDDSAVNQTTISTATGDGEGEGIQQQDPTTTLEVTQDKEYWLTRLSLAHCGLGPAACRALAQGVMQRFNNTVSSSSSSSNVPPPPLSLDLARNTWIGNGGTAALAAAIRELVTATSEDDEGPSSAQSNNNETMSNNNSTAAQQPQPRWTLFDTLDLSGCGITDAGAQALALALEDVSADQCLAIRHLDLSNNQITEEGATALARALLLAAPSSSCPENVIVQSLDLSNNPIGDRGALHLAAVMEQGRLPTLTARSCHIHANGAAAFGKALRALVAATAKTTSQNGTTATATRPTTIGLDLSGNPLGMLRGKSKRPGEGGKYSASRLKSTATATAASYMNRIKKGLKDVGVSDLISGKGAADSDDEEQLPGEEDESDTESSGSGKDASKKTCGVKTFVNAFLQENDDDVDHDDDQSSDIQATDRNQKGDDVVINLGLRHCFLDHGAADALAAIQIEAARAERNKGQRKSRVVLDVSLNPVLEEDMVAALHLDVSKKSKKRADAYYMDQRVEMAERYIDMLQAIRESKRRAAEAREARVRMMQQRRERDRLEDEEEDDLWGDGGSSSFGYNDEDESNDYEFGTGDDEWDEDEDEYDEELY